MDHLTKYHLLIMIQNSFSFNLSKPSKGLAPSLGKSCLQIRRVGLQASNPLGEWKCMQWKLHLWQDMKSFISTSLSMFATLLAKALDSVGCLGCNQKRSFELQCKLIHMLTLWGYSRKKKKQSASKILLVNLYNFTFPPCLLKHPKS